MTTQLEVDFVDMESRDLTSESRFAAMHETREQAFDPLTLRTSLLLVPQGHVKSFRHWGINE